MTTSTKEVFGVFLNSDLPSRKERKALFDEIRSSYTLEGFITRQAAQEQADEINQVYPAVKAHAAEYIDIGF